MPSSTYAAPGAGRLLTSRLLAPSRRRRLAPRHGALAALLLTTAALYTWHLSRSGWGNDFYAAASQAGAMSWKAWLFGSLDPGNVITVDKPPAATWVSGLSVRILGLSSWSILLPQALEGVLSVAVLYSAVRRVLLGSGSATSASAGGLIAGAVLAATPAAALIFRFNNPDALLVLLMTLAAYCTIRACERASWRWLALCGVALGFAFLTKMLQGLLVLPGFGLTYLLFARAPWWQRIRDGVIGVVAVVASAGWYVVVTMVWPAGSRPYIGGSSNNSFMDLVLGYNGLARILGNSAPSGSHGSGREVGLPAMSGGAPGTAFGGRAGLERLFSNEFGNEISWLLPSALIVLGAMVIWAARRRLAGDVAAAVTAFGTWLVVTAGVFAYMSGTVHPYYTVALAPAMAALIGIGSVTGWRRRSEWAGTALLSSMVLAAAVWGIVRAWRAQFVWPVFGWVVGALGLCGVIALVAGREWVGRRAVGVAAAALVGGVGAMGWFGVATANNAHSGSVPTAVQTRSDTLAMGMPTSAGPPMRRAPDAPFGGAASADPAVVALLKSTRTEWSAAVDGAQSQAGLQLDSRTAVIAIGGFGGDPAPTLTQFEKLVAEGRIGYFISNGGDGMPGGPGDGSIATWVEQHFSPTTVGSSTVYKLTR